MEAQLLEPQFHVQRLHYQGEGRGARLVGIGNSMVLHDEQGHRMYWERQGGESERYRYAADGRLLSVERNSPRGSRSIEYEHDGQGRRSAKYVDGQLAARYEWHDLVRLARAWTPRGAMEFRYARGSRLPVGLVLAGEPYSLHYDQVGSLRAVAGESGDMISEIVYDAFGRIQEESNPGLGMPLGFAGGLHDRDTGWVRFGFRDYDPLTGRFTAMDPLGYAAGDPDLYGYCLDDPVNAVDPNGLMGMIPTDTPGGRLLTSTLEGMAGGAITGALGGVPGVALGAWAGGTAGLFGGTVRESVQEYLYGDTDEEVTKPKHPIGR
ncbi:MAG: RHS repeat domain-containing protein [Desulfovibrionaceae bacterium]